jgi:uncharacterized protein (DUF488 family)
VKNLNDNSGGRGRQISEFKASLVYRVSSRTARAIQRNPVSKNQKKKKRDLMCVKEMKKKCYRTLPLSMLLLYRRFKALALNSGNTNTSEIYLPSKLKRDSYKLQEINLNPSQMDSR